MRVEWEGEQRAQSLSARWGCVRFVNRGRRPGQTPGGAGERVGFNHITTLLA